jgi:hypothetical protein
VAFEALLTVHAAVVAVVGSALALAAGVAVVAAAVGVAVGFGAVADPPHAASRKLRMASGAAMRERYMELIASSECVRSTLHAGRERRLRIR